MADKLTALDWLVITDTLHGSLSIADGNGYLFKYTEAGRKATHAKIIGLMASTILDILGDPRDARFADSDQEEHHLPNMETFDDLIKSDSSATARNDPNVKVTLT